MAHAGAGKMTRVRERKQLPEQNCSNAESVESSELIIVAVRLSGVAHDAHDVSCLSDERVRFWVGIQWRADDLIFDFDTCPNHQKLS